MDGKGLVLPTTAIDTIATHSRFLILSLPNNEMSRKSPFAIQKALKGIGGDPKSVKKLHSGDLLIETVSTLQSKSFLLAKTFIDSTLTVTPHKSLNSCCGVISEPDLLYASEAEILEGLSDQGITQVRRITILRDSTHLPTKHIILTFNSPKLPTTIKAGYLNCKIRPYIPNPLRCFKCQRYGHSQTSCRGQLTCSRCASAGHASTDCILEPKSRKLIAPQLSKTTATTTTQTDENITKIVCPPLKLLQPLITDPKPTISSSVAAVNKSSTSTQAELVPSTSSVTVTSPSKSQHTNSLIDTVSTASDNLSISTASSSSTACSVLETTTTTYNTIPTTSQDTTQTSKPRRKKRPPKNQSNTIKPKIEIKTAPHRPR
ncbi:uncharacterized protein TNCV_3568891 [Trichonephila clavipes]|nr:uncharacterized protein TNCV_3568891 [Trichonephila clavipes]